MAGYRIVRRDDGTRGIWDLTGGAWANPERYRTEGAANRDARHLEHANRKEPTVGHIEDAVAVLRATQEDLPRAQVQSAADQLRTLSGNLALASEKYAGGIGGLCAHLAGQCEEIQRGMAQVDDDINREIGQLLAMGG